MTPPTEPDKPSLKERIEKLADLEERSPFVNPVARIVQLRAIAAELGALAGAWYMGRQWDKANRGVIKP